MIPSNPKIGQLYYDHPTGTMRKWDGKHWKETTPTEIRNDIQNRKKRTMAGSYDSNKA